MSVPILRSDMIQLPENGSCHLEKAAASGTNPLVDPADTGTVRRAKIGAVAFVPVPVSGCPEKKTNAETTQDCCLSAGRPIRFDTQFYGVLQKAPVRVPMFTGSSMPAQSRRPFIRNLPSSRQTASESRVCQPDAPPPFVRLHSPQTVEAASETARRIPDVEPLDRGIAPPDPDFYSLPHPVPHQIPKQQVSPVFSR